MFPNDGHTLAELLTIYEQQYLAHMALTTQAHHHIVFQALMADYGEKTMAELTPALLREWREGMRQRHKPGTVRQYMATVSGAFTFAVEELEWLAASPMRKVRKPPEPAARVRFLSAEELPRLLQACQRSRNPYLHILVWLAVTTGGRKNELRCLQWPEVDVQQGILRFPRTKNKDKRPVPVVGQALELLRGLARTAVSPWLFPRRDGKLPVLIERAWRMARDRAQLVDFHFHDLRHTAAAYMAMSGATLREIAEILGHTRIQQTLKYAHLTLPHTRGVMERMAERFLPV